MFSQTLTIARNTFLESVRQPIYFILTAIAGGGLLISAPLGIGIVSGLVLYQIMFVLNVFRVIVVQGVAE